MKSIWLAGLAALPSPAWAVDCFAEGNAAYRAGRFEAARAAFSAMRGLPECQADPLLLLNLARSAQALVERGKPELACTAAQEYAAFLKTKPDELLAGVAEDGRSSMALQCSVTETSAADRTEVWIWTGAAVGTLVLGGVFNGLARGSAQDGSAAAADQRAATDQASYNAAKARADEAYDRAETQALTSYALFGVGAGLAGVAVWRWLSLDSEASVAVAPSHNGFALIGRW